MVMISMITWRSGCCILSVRGNSPDSFTVLVSFWKILLVFPHILHILPIQKTNRIGSYHKLKVKTDIY